MQIGNYNLSLPSGVAFKWFSIFFWGFMIFVVLGLISWMFYRNYRNKTTYTNGVTLDWIYENGTKRTFYGLKGGRFINHHGVWDFKVRIPKQFKKKELGYMPDFSYADTDGTLHFITSGDGTIWQQCIHKIITKERVVDGNKVTEMDLLIKPVRTDVKTVTVNSLKNWSEMINKNKITMWAIGLGMFLIMVIAHLISLYVQTKVKCGG